MNVEFDIVHSHLFSALQTGDCGSPLGFMGHDGGIVFKGVFRKTDL